MTENRATDSADSMVQYLTFLLDDEVFALEIAKVREVLELGELTQIPRTPDFCTPPWSPMCLRP